MLQVLPMSCFLMVPGFALRMVAAEQVKQLFSAHRPGWVEAVREGDIIVGGKNFGTGSGRPGARSLYRVGVRALIADSNKGSSCAMR